jgi:hypothetical protein
MFAWDILSAWQSCVQAHGGHHGSGGDAMAVYQALTLAISFAGLIVLILSFKQKK